MSTSKKTSASIRQGGPGAAHEDANEPLQAPKPPAEPERRKHSDVSGGGGERDAHHGREPGRKGGG